jgi:hypothetical protein
MEVNGVGIPPTPMLETELWCKKIWKHRHSLNEEKCADPTWRPFDNDSSGGSNSSTLGGN